MGEGSYDADCFAEAREALVGLRELLHKKELVYTGDVLWVDRKGIPTKLKDFDLRRLRAILGFLNKNKEKNRDWVAIIKNEISYREKGPKS